MNQTAKLFTFTVTIRALPTADQQWQLVNGGFANGLVRAHSEAAAIDAFRSELARIHWELVEVRARHQVDEAVAQQHDVLRELLELSRSTGVGFEVFPAVRGPESDSLQ